MKPLLLLAIALGFSLRSSTGTQEAPTPATPPADSHVYREPFTLRVRVDKDHYYEEHYDKRIPYVLDGDVYIFSGEDFGLQVTANGAVGADVAYQPDSKKADVWLSFAQPKDLGVGMLLTIKNNLKQQLRVDALMTIPGKQGIYKTSIIPIEAALSDFESWPHPIAQLVLRNFRLSESQLKPRH